MIASKHVHKLVDIVNRYATLLSLHQEHNNISYNTNNHFFTFLSYFYFLFSEDSTLNKLRQAHTLLGEAIDDLISK